VGFCGALPKKKREAFYCYFELFCCFSGKFFSFFFVGGEEGGFGFGAFMVGLELLAVV
jgi:hypothetical protein